MKITVRLIHSFEFSNVFYMVVEASGETTVQQLAELVKSQVESNNKYRPVRPKLGAYDTFRVYCHAGEDKNMNLCFNDKQGVEVHKDSQQTVAELGWEEGVEVSYYPLQNYKTWKGQ